MDSGTWELENDSNSCLWKQNAENSYDLVVCRVGRSRERDVSRRSKISDKAFFFLFFLSFFSSFFFLFFFEDECLEEWGLFLKPFGDFGGAMFLLIVLESSGVNICSLGCGERFLIS